MIEFYRMFFNGKLDWLLLFIDCLCVQVMLFENVLLDDDVVIFWICESVLNKQWLILCFGE